MVSEGGRRVALLVNPNRSGATELAERARAWWEAAGYEVISDLVGGALIAEVLEPVDFAISFGGDGTMLRAIQATAGRKIPVLGVNLGNLGYLTQSEPESVETCFARLVSGDHGVDWRMGLGVRVITAAGGAESFFAINEATLERTAPGHTVRVSVDINDRPFLTYAADGLIVATPTGSTAYNLSAHGPVVSPRLRVLVFTPISPHLLFDRPLVLGGDETVRFTLVDDRSAALVVDGVHVATLERDDTVEVAAAGDDVPFVSFDGRDHFAVLRAKFSVAGR